MVETRQPVPHDTEQSTSMAQEVATIAVAANRAAAMNSTITVHVTQAHIDAAADLAGRWSVNKNPLALALHDVGFDDALVGIAHWACQDGWAWLTNRAGNWLARWMYGKPVQPATFRLRLP